MFDLKYKLCWKVNLFFSREELYHSKIDTLASYTNKQAKKIFINKKNWLTDWLMVLFVYYWKMKKKKHQHRKFHSIPFIDCEITIGFFDINSRNKKKFFFFWKFTLLQHMCINRKWSSSSSIDLFLVIIKIILTFSNHTTIINLYVIN